MRRDRVRGFTLLEMIIAVAVFSVIALVSYTALARVMDTAEGLSAHHARMQALQTTFGLLGRDLRHAADRSVRDGYGDTQSALLARPYDPPAPGELFRLTTLEPLAALDPLQRPLRVAWRLEGDALVRVHWPVPDRARDTPERRRLMLEDIREFAVRFVVRNEQGELVAAEEWTAQGLPHGAQVALVDGSGRRYHRLFEFPGS